jgi:UDP-N-acetyl-D-mannosaminuronate dehydrogenase
LNKNLVYENENKKVLVIGLGQLGLPVAKYVKEKGFDVYGYDISQKAMERAEKVASINKISDDSNFGEFDVFILCVSTHKADDMFTPQIDSLLSIIEEKISKEAKNNVLVSVESTIPRGISRKIFEMVNHRLHVAHVPHRWYGLEEKEHGVNQLRVAGGVNGCCLNAAMQFYSNGTDYIGRDKMSIRINRGNRCNNDHNSCGIYTNAYGTGLGIPLYPVSNIEIAEITKIAENAHRYLQIAFAEDLYLYCQANNINFPELRDALNTKWNVNILEPRDGIGGHCLPKDVKMFLESSRSSKKSKILNAAIDVDRDYRRHLQAKGIVIQEVNKVEKEEKLNPLLTKKFGFKNSLN